MVKTHDNFGPIPKAIQQEQPEKGRKRARQFRFEIRYPNGTTMTYDRYSKESFLQNVQCIVNEYKDEGEVVSVRIMGRKAS